MPKHHDRRHDEDQGAKEPRPEGVDGGHDPRIAFPGLRYADGIGPTGWNAAIASLVDGAATGLTR